MQGSFLSFRGAWELVQEGLNTLLTHLETLHLSLDLQREKSTLRPNNRWTCLFISWWTHLVLSLFGFMITQSRTTQVPPSHVYQAVPQAALVSKQEKELKKSRFNRSKHSHLVSTWSNSVDRGTCCGWTRFRFIYKSQLCAARQQGSISSYCIPALCNLTGWWRVWSVRFWVTTCVVFMLSRVVVELWRPESSAVQLYFDLWDCKSVIDVFGQTASEEVLSLAISRRWIDN